MLSSSKVCCVNQVCKEHESLCVEVCVCGGMPLFVTKATTTTASAGMKRSSHSSPDNKLTSEPCGLMAAKGSCTACGASIITHKAMSAALLAKVGDVQPW